MTWNLEDYLGKIHGLDQEAVKAAKDRQSQLAKPPGSLGELEEISIRLAGITGKVKNELEKRRILVLAADNGVVAEGVSSAPQSVTWSQCLNMTKHKTGMSSLACFFGDEVVITDVGVASEIPSEEILNRKLMSGTGNIAKEPAMSRETCLKAIEVGISLAEACKKDGVMLAGVGEMGIGNTTTSSAVLCALTGNCVEAVTGRGGGLTEEAFQKKKQVIEQALNFHKPKKEDVVDVLSKVGGLDLAAMTGVFLGCAKERIPVVVDGFISIVAALCAVRLKEEVREFLFLSHTSYEVGYEAARAEIGHKASLNLGLRLGEGSGCPLMFQIMRGACAVMNQMATFEEGAINDDYLEEIRTQDAF